MKGSLLGVLMPKSPPYLQFCLDLGAGSEKSNRPLWEYWLPRGGFLIAVMGKPQMTFGEPDSVGGLH